MGSHGFMAAHAAAAGLPMPMQAIDNQEIRLVVDDHPAIMGALQTLLHPPLLRRENRLACYPLEREGELGGLLASIRAQSSLGAGMTGRHLACSWAGMPMGMPGLNPA